VLVERGEDRLGKWGPLIVLSLAQFLMVIGQAVMNVSISQQVEDFDTDVTAIQGVITFYALTMAMLMITGGKVGDILGRRRTFAVGHLVYPAGSALTAASWSVGSLLVGWSILEGVGAALVLPALVALVAANYTGQDRSPRSG
jgi:MFS family permease